MVSLSRQLCDAVDGSVSLEHSWGAAIFVINIEEFYYLHFEMSGLPQTLFPRGKLRPRRL